MSKPIYTPYVRKINIDDEYRKNIHDKIKFKKHQIDDEVLLCTDHTMLIIKDIRLILTDLDNAENEKKKVYRDLSDYYKNDYEIVLKGEEIKRHVEQDDDYIQASTIVNEIRHDLDFLQDCKEAIKSKGWNVKNYIEWKKFINGQ